MKNRLFLLALLLLTCLRLAPAGAAPDFEAARLNAAAANPPGVSLTLSLPPGRTQFHQGEVIPLTATFASRLPKAYRLNTGPGDRELPWNSDAFQVDDTTGAVDPLAVYYAHELGMASSGAGPQFQDLAAQPVLIPYTLNEWLRFDVPGHYRVYLTSGRIINVGGPRPDFFRFHGRAMASNAVDLEILPRDPVQDAQTLQQALPLFNADGFDPRVQKAKEAAARAIRFLGTPDAVRVMVARYGQFTDYRQLNYFAYRQTRLGLFGFPQPSVVIQEMGRRLTDPDFPVFSIFLEDLAQTHFFAAYPQPLPPYDAADPLKTHQWYTARAHFSAVLTSLKDQNRQTLALTVEAKKGKARAISLYTLLGADYAHPDTAEYGAVARALVPVFDDLTPEEQNNLLGYDRWCKINAPVLLPLLRRLYARPSPDSEPGTFQGNEAVQFYSLTLRRLSDLSPAEGRVLLLAEIKSFHPRVDLPTLCSLPDRRLPALDDTLAANLEIYRQNRKGSEQIPTGLVERYGTRGILPRIKAAYGNGGSGWGSDGKSNLLAYFLRTDYAYGVKQMETTLASRTGSFHYRYILSGVAALAPGPDVEKLAASPLHDPNTQVQSDAVKTLGTYGSSAAEAPLWARMREWHRQWAGRAEKITPEAGQLEYALTFALATSPGWLADRAKLQALENLCVTPNARSNMAGFVKEWAAPISIIYMGERDDWSVVQYGQLSSLAALENKLEFPRGTRFRLSSVNLSDKAQRARAFGRLKPFLEKRGMRLEMEPLPAR